MRVLFDADSMVYGCGFATQKTLYDWTASDGTEIVQQIFTAADDMKAANAMLPEGWSSEHQTLVEAEPLENALALCKRQIYGIEERLENQGLSFPRVELFLTGGENFRNAIATIRPYKGNRTLEKPVHYKAIRRYLVNNWQARVVNGWEADDEVATIACQLDYDPEKVLIVSQDKDLRTVPGLLYNYRRKSFEYVSPRTALVNFYRQIVTGDAVDNIMGIYRAGEKVALTEIRADMTERQMWDKVVSLCAASQEKKGCPYTAMQPSEVVLEFARLLHLRRHPNDLWLPPDSRPKSGRPESSAESDAVPSNAASA